MRTVYSSMSDSPAPPCVPGTWPVASVEAVEEAVRSLHASGVLSSVEQVWVLQEGTSRANRSGGRSVAQWNLVVRDAYGVRLRVRHHLRERCAGARGKVGVEGPAEAVGRFQWRFLTKVAQFRGGAGSSPQSTVEPVEPVRTEGEEELYDPFAAEVVGEEPYDA